MSFSKLVHLFYTLRYLKLSQLLWRIRYLLTNTSVALDLGEYSTHDSFKLKSVCLRPTSYQNNTFKFLNHSVLNTGSIDWNDTNQSKLWLYNLHYFDFLQQADLDKHQSAEIIHQWITNNPAFDGNGWEPYPLSLRIVNWIKYLQQDDFDDPRSQHMCESLYLQARSLRNQLEYHLLGNHLFKNAVALLYAGCFFKSDEASEWYEKGKSILLDQLEEQVLTDGGHFERSPMYHALILEDILDCLNLVTANQSTEEETILTDQLTSKAHSMLGFLDDIKHPDQSLPVFNDTAQGIASTPEQLFSYARSLNLDWKKSTGNLIQKNQFGLFVLKNNLIHCVIDAGQIGPDYLPGHAHCDTLSYELAFKGQLFIVNAGVFEYAGAERNIYRATRSHNTVEIDNAEQHEIWSTFRVARRGYPRNVTAEQDQQKLLFSGQHTGYQRIAGQPIHQRDLCLLENDLTIVDRVTGKGAHSAKSFIHFHPQVEIIEQTKHQLKLKRNNAIVLLNISEEFDWSLDSYAFSAEFGLKQNASMIFIQTDGNNDFSFSYSFHLIN